MIVLTLTFNGSPFVAMPFNSVAEFRDYWRARRFLWRGFKFTLAKAESRIRFREIQSPCTIPRT